ncbi:hypothetical protein FA15DRAFT_669030 [Coprinopsis marcescibilis]|uniref:Uncharacterized protein n=1 Tax=Coprinopsis marcescibilis TaxID=230819 RepID=A0A5C3KWE5_COPMA|nr:hypothetical protein FA15DRAFT_669030 [Coprinopsis marcescibilis]
MSQEFTLLVDDQDPSVNYLCPSLQQEGLGGSYSNRTWTTIKDASCVSGWFEYTFYGTGIHIHVPVAKTAESAAVLLDNVLFKPSADGVFEAKNLTDGKHKFTYGIGEVKALPVFDYLTVTAGRSTKLNGRTLLADDTDDSVVFDGNWSTKAPQQLDFDHSTNLYKDSAHWSSTVGDTVRFEFIGTSVSVFGLVNNITDAGNLTASYTIDGATTTLGIPEGTFDSVPMTELYHADLQPGLHTLVVNLTEIGSPRLALGIDFIAYNTSVDSVTSLPGYELTANANAAPDPSKPGASSSSSAKNAILGGVLGGVGFLILLGIAFFFWRRRQSKTAVRLASTNSSQVDFGATVNAEKQVQPST